MIDIISGITGLPKANLKKDMTFVDSEHRISSKNESKKISDLVVEVKDNAGNTATCSSGTIKVDTTAPTISLN